MINGETLTLTVFNFMTVKTWRHDIKYNDTWHNDIPLNVIYIMGFFETLSINDTQHNVMLMGTSLLLCWVSYFYCYAEYQIFIVMLRIRFLLLCWVSYFYCYAEYQILIVMLRIRFLLLCWVLLCEASFCQSSWRLTVAIRQSE